MKTTQNCWRVLATTLFLLVTWTLTAQIQIPAAINYQGKLTDNQGDPLTNGYYIVEFRIWKDPTLAGAAELAWGRSIPIHVVESGLFNVLLSNDGAELPDGGTGSLLGAFDGPDRYLGVTVVQTPSGTVAVPAEIKPRQRLVSAPYTIQAQNANLVAPDGVTTESLSTWSVTTTKIAPSNVTSVTIASDAVITDKLADGAVTTGKIAGSAVTTAKIANGAVTSAKLASNVALLDRDPQHFSGTNTFATALGIGTTAPDRPLAIHGQGLETEWISLKDTNGATAWHINRKGGGLNFARTGVADGRLFLADSGRVGIGTLAPVNAFVEIKGTISYDHHPYGYVNGAGSTGKSTAAGAAAYSLYSDGRMAAQEFNAVSDARIKNVLGMSDTRQDLETLLRIAITDYTMRDDAAYGGQQFKKVIAQQVEQVYPLAVTSNLTEVVPDLYQRSMAVSGWIALDRMPEPPLQTGDLVRLITERGTELHKISGVEGIRFQVEGLDDGPLFVYGRQVDDFRTVDYDAISMLNVSATQELYRQLTEARENIRDLRAQIDRLGSALEAAQRRDDATRQRLTRVEGMIADGHRDVQQASLRR